jgi:hypothetical protein
MDIEKAKESLECALINCDNIKRVGLVMVDVVKEQIRSAIKELEKN